MRYVYDPERNRIDVTGLGSVCAYFHVAPGGARPEIKIIRRCAFEWEDYTAEDAQLRAQIEDDLNAQLGVPWTAGTWQDLIEATHALAEAHRARMDDLEIVPQSLFERESKSKGRETINQSL